MRKTILAAALAFCCALGAFAQGEPARDAYAIMKAADAKATPKTTHALVKMELVDEKGGVSERIVEEWTSEDPAGLSSSVIVFHSPASVKNSRFLSKENAGRDADKWIWLPALKKIRRIAASEGGGSFMGTEFSYDDMAVRKLDGYDYRYVGSETVKGYDCHVIEVTPKDPKTSQYAKIVTWIIKDPEVLMALRIDMYRNAAAPASKTLTILELRKVGAYWTPMSVTMKNDENGRATNLVQQNIEYDKPVDAARFTTRFLETGRID
ncbi:MAG: outer membrane lipoprotein-sorting protein [Spirochaetes bacterium]|nr:outer membrane lipoprotein-sorting protein [Spirochaetota bacterium]